MLSKLAFRSNGALGSTSRWFAVFPALASSIAALLKPCASGDATALSSTALPPRLSACSTRSRGWLQWRRKPCIMPGNRMRRSTGPCVLPLLSAMLHLQLQCSEFLLNPLFRILLIWDRFKIIIHNFNIFGSLLSSLWFHS